MNEEPPKNKRLFKNQWELVLKGDHKTFNEMAEPYLDEMSQIAEREILYLQYLGHFGQDDLNTNELVGEALLQAWDRRHKRPDEISIKAWLLGTLQRVIQRKVRQADILKSVESVSLESPVLSENYFDEDQSFWDWHQPDDFTKWEDIIEDHHVLPEDYILYEEGETNILPGQFRDVIFFHDKHSLKPHEVAYLMN